MRSGTGWRTVLGMVVALAMSGCGGGGGDDGDGIVTTPPTASPVPVPTATASPTTPSTGNWWRPVATTTWQWQLSGTVDTRYAVDAYDIDLFDTPAATIAQLHLSKRRVICYFSAGSSENWRSDDGKFVASDRGSALDGWVGERWLSVTSATVRAVMQDRLDLARSKGCDAVEPDNVDGYANRNGLGITAAQQLDYNRFLAREAHARGLAIGLKNDLDQVAALEGVFDFAVNEQCHEFDECGKLKPFVSAAKSVFVAEYKADYRNNSGGARDRLCAASRAAGLHTLVLAEALDNSFRFACDVEG
ncbi:MULTISPECIES: endo alpha-1,4 polygalactosaminidase [unclassified Sphingomonas]|uniref:endo alpha-1,4 polygalactosaminidase n=1 Tax=unclassified Sphingomonas TaxID=196159 RepID=UPI0006F57513|nr:MULTISPECIES: endo alpha-1,4 polygalactosaminidase [unclassified Sphingomonas]KQM59996.1 endo alpha-1,4 polygalactosaminidase [Sphingomonas sp. Leaf16]KQN11395.1 endo alpha-1,4 polygalactosaminidase [Sphingomonas sp. Leaf29]KQN18715.1 endo alpha-1,4 polygalactosaminidase [Sphingomonas sp. Leaf32]